MAFNGFVLRTERSAAYNHEPGRGEEALIPWDDQEENHLTHLWCSRCHQTLTHRNMVCPTCGHRLGG